MDFLAPLISFFKSTAKVFAGVALASLAVIVAPAGWLKPLGLDALRDQYRGVLAFALVISSAFLIVDIVAATYSAGRARHQRKKEAAAAENAEREEANRKAVATEAKKTKIIEFLNRMTEDERAQCRKFIGKEARTHWLNAESGVVADLVRRGVLYQANPVGHVDLEMQAWGAYFSMNDSSWNYLHEHPECLTKIR